MDTLRKYPEIPVEFENDFVREFMIRHLAGELGPDIQKKISDGSVRINEIELYKRMSISGKSSVTPLFVSSDQMVDGVCLFNANKIPKDANFLLTHISLKHAFNAAPTSDPPTTAQIAAAYYHNLIGWKITNTNAAAATPITIATVRDTDQVNKVPEELLAADLVVSIGGVVVFKRTVRSMFFDPRISVGIDVKKGVELLKKIMVKEDQVVNAYLNFPSGISITAYGSGTSTNLVEFTLWGVGTSIKG